MGTRAASAVQMAEQSQVHQAQPRTQGAEEGVGVRGGQACRAEQEEAEPEGAASEHATGQSASSLQPELEPTCKPQDPRYLLSELEYEPSFPPVLLEGSKTAAKQVSSQVQEETSVSVCGAEQKAAFREHMARLHERIGTYEFGTKHRLTKEVVCESRWENLKVRITAQLRELEVGELKRCGRL